MVVHCLIVIIIILIKNGSQAIHDKKVSRIIVSTQILPSSNIYKAILTFCFTTFVETTKAPRRKYRQEQEAIRISINRVALPRTAEPMSECPKASLSPMQLKRRVRTKIKDLAHRKDRTGETSSPG